MNDKCAAGTGRFLENMAKALEISMEQMANDGLKYSEDISISNMCTVFAESEVISLISENKKIADIIHGLNKSVAIKTKALASKALGADGVMMTGGVANNKGVVTELEKQLNTKIFISDKPEFCGAIGAGLFAVDSDRLLERLECNALNINPKNLVILIGTNDIGIGVPTEYTLKNIKEILQRTQTLCSNTAVKSSIRA